MVHHRAQHEHHRVPVTALAYWNDHILLSGQGTHLRAYDTASKVCLSSHPVFATQAIHGISIQHGSSEPVILVRGGQLVRVLIAEISSNGSWSFEQSTILDASDWILDASFAIPQEGRGTRAALATAHNALIICDVTTDRLLAQLNLVVPGSNCILYSANIAWLDHSRCLIASGTAFGDIIVWSCSILDNNSKPSALSKTHYVFSAHQGSIFGVTISSSEIAAGFEGRSHLLASCSDDRTIRLWDISDLTVESPTLLELQRQTGFGTEDPKDAHGPLCLSVTMGHISRIWHVRFVRDYAKSPDDASPAPTQAVVLSFGEDASCITWAVEASSASAKTPFQMRQLSAMKAHSGKSIWSVSISRQSQVATGGADGAIATTSSAMMIKGNLLLPIDRSLANPHTSGDTFKSYAFIDRGTLYATTDQGHAMKVRFGPDGAFGEEYLSADPRLRGYSVVESIGGKVFFAGISGTVDVKVYHPFGMTRTEVASTGRKVADLFAARGDNDHPHDCKLLITNVGTTTAQVADIRGEGHGLYATAVTSILELPAGFVVTSFAWDPNDNTFAVGARAGTIAIFRTGASGHVNPSPTLFQGIHGKQAVTSLVFHSGPAASSHDFLLLFSTGRDGTYACQRLSFENDGCQMQCIHQLSLPFGPNIEGMEIQTNGNLWVWGFRSHKFIVYDITLQREIMTQECGGAHRNWTFQSEANGGEFVWTKASNLFYARQDELPYENIAVGGHGREVKCLSISSGSPAIIATGAEDTNIKLSTYQRGCFIVLQTLQKHNTGIQHLEWSSDNRFLFSSGGFEEFCVWRVTYDVLILDIGIVCESTHPNHGTSDLRVMNFDAQMVSSSENGKDAFMITMAYSNSTLVQWRYTDKTWSLIAEGSYLTSCLTQCLRFGPGNNLLTASTDGHIALWALSPSPTAPTTQNQQPISILPVDTPTDAATDNLPSCPTNTLTWSIRYPIHQSAILTATTHTLPDSTTLLLTGGDDNAIGITRLPFPSSSPPTPSPSSKLPPPRKTILLTRAHAAAITALSFLGSRCSSSSLPVAEGSDKHNQCGLLSIRFISAGLDQRVKIWEIVVDPGKAGVGCVRSVGRVRSDSSPSGDGGVGGDDDVGESRGSGSSAGGTSTGPGGDFFTPVADVSGLETFSIDNDDGDDDQRSRNGGGSDDSVKETGEVGVLGHPSSSSSHSSNRTRRRAICIGGVGMDIWKLDDEW